MVCGPRPGRLTDSIAPGRGRVLSFVGGTAVVTGAASGIGLALAEAAAAEGTNVALLDLPGDRLVAAAHSPWWSTASG
jgi:NADPH:quinone reductase-like Zn-dependent oxidoreductase